MQQYSALKEERRWNSAEDAGWNQKLLYYNYTYVIIYSFWSRAIDNMCRDQVLLFFVTRKNDNNLYTVNITHTTVSLTDDNNNKLVFYWSATKNLYNNNMYNMFSTMNVRVCFKRTLDDTNSHGFFFFIVSVLLNS